MPYIKALGESNALNFFGQMLSLFKLKLPTPVTSSLFFKYANTNSTKPSRPASQSGHASNLASESSSAVWPLSDPSSANSSVALTSSASRHRLPILQIDTGHHHQGANHHTHSIICRERTSSALLQKWMEGSRVGGREILLGMIVKRLCILSMREGKGC